MPKVLAVLATLLAVLGLAASADAASTATGSADPEAALATRMLAGIGGQGNTVLSPTSLYTAMAMVDQGASGQTAAQLDALLGVGTPAQAATTVASARPRHVAGGPTLRSANGLWVASHLKLNENFADTLAQKFAASPQQVDFADNPGAAIDQINGWVSDHTAGLIPTLMGPGDITAQTNLVLANALYLNARWADPFDPNRTQNAVFHTATGSVTTPFMNSSETASYPYAAGHGYQAIALPYARSSLQFLAIMPPAGQLATLAKSLTGPTLDQIANGLSTRAVQLSLPKFSLSFQTSLNGFLQQQGVTRAFGASSQLNHMVAGRSLAIQAVEQAAVLKVAEKGTVAAAATGVSVAPTAVAANPVELSLNRPFLVFLRDTRTGAVLFAARVANPASAS